ncbi:MAG: YdcF family protein [Chloroflexi bacterium]|nr:YdcF family protein [Chloroflexota bacterium]
MMPKQLSTIILRIVIYSGFAALGLVLLPRVYTTLLALPRMAQADHARPAPVALVFGAALRRDGGPSAVLRDRLDAAIELYRAGKVKILLMSGAGAEPAAMQTYAVEQGVLPEDIRLDEGGLRTYDSCYRAAHVFGLGEVVLVTNHFHLPRALYLCAHFGLEANGAWVDESRYWHGALVFWNIRETLATVAALWEAHVSRPAPSISEFNPTLEAAW